MTRALTVWWEGAVVGSLALDPDGQMQHRSAPSRLLPICRFRDCVGCLPAVPPARPSARNGWPVPCNRLRAPKEGTALDIPG